MQHRQSLHIFRNLSSLSDFYSLSKVTVFLKGLYKDCKADAMYVQSKGLKLSCEFFFRFYGDIYYNSKILSHYRKSLRFLFTVCHNLIILLQASQMMNFLQLMTANLFGLLKSMRRCLRLLIFFKAQLTIISLVHLRF